MAIKIKSIDTAKYFDTEEAQRDLLRDALASGEAPYIAKALGTIARAQGMTKLANATGLNRQALYAALSGDGNPSFDTIMKVVDALGLQLSAVSRELEVAA